MKKYFEFIHNPKKVTIASIILAVTIGIIGYAYINKAPASHFAKAEAGTVLGVWTSGTSTEESGQNLTLSFLASGKIDNVLVKVGDLVKSGQKLAVVDPGNTEGALTQAKAVYESAVANYEKLVNGATSNDVSVSNISVEIAQTTLNHNKETLIIALNNVFTGATNAVNNNTNILFNSPTSENPDLIKDSVIFNNQNLVNKIIDEKILLNKMFPIWKQELNNISINSDLENISDNALINLHSIATHIDDLNSLFTLYSSAGNNNFQTVLAIDQSNILSARTAITNQITSLTNASQLVSSSQKNLDQSQAILKQKISAARPEDIAIAEAQIKNALGAVQIAEASYNNHIITAPSDGSITAVYITTGQIATQNSPAIDFSGKTFSKEVSVMIPNNSIINRGGKSFVSVKSGNILIEKEIIVGANDQKNTEVVSGLEAGNEVVIH